MTQVSPSNKKVNDFLSSLSQLSQERLREDQQRQRNLQRNIDELQLRLASTSPSKSSISTTSSTLATSYYGYSVPDLKFNRSRLTVENTKEQTKHNEKVYEEEDEEEAPKLPQRPINHETATKNPPPLPKRKYKEEIEEKPPALPARKPELEKINLLKPVARKSSFPMPLKPTQPNLNVNLNASNESSGKHRSFKDIEELIKSGNTVKKTAPRPPEKLTTDKPTVTSPKTPVKPTKADWLTSLSTAKTTTSTPQAVSPDSKRPVPPIISHKNWIDSAVSKTDTKPPVEKPSKPSFLKKTTKPEIPKKPNLPKENLFETEEEAEFKLKFKELKSVSASVSPEKVEKKITGVPQNKVIVEFEAKLAQLRSQSPTRKPIERTKDEQEYLSKFEKVKAAPIPPLRPKSMTFNNPPPEFQKRFEKIVTKAPPKPIKPSKVSLSTYQEKDTKELMSQLKRLGSPKKEDQEKPKVEHKKEEDTKDIVTSNGGNEQSKRRTRGPKRRLPKLKEIGDLKPTRVISGELFI